MAVVAVSVGSMLGSGIFVLPGVGFAITGPSLFLAFLLAAIGIVPAAISKSELATAMPTSGGPYVYLERTFGPLAGTVAGLGLFLSMLLKAAFALMGFGAYLEIVASVPLEQTASGLLIVIVILNILGVRKVSGLLGLVTIISIVTLVSLSIYSFPNLKQAHFDTFLTHGPYGLVETVALVFISFAGVTKIAAIAEEVKNPGRNVPRAIFFSMAVVTIIYCGLTIILAGTLPMESLQGNLRLIHTLAEFIGGPTLGLVVAVVAILNMSSVANAGLLAASRFPFAMSRDKLLPVFLSRIHPKFLTPFWSILIAGGVIALAIWLLDVERIAKLASVFIIIMFMFVNVAVIVLRETHVQWYKPTYRSPFYPFVQLFGIVIYLILLMSMGFFVPMALMIICIPGLFIYLLFSRKRTDRRGVLGIRGPRRDLITSESRVIHKEVQEMEFKEETSVVVAMFGKERSPEVLTKMGLDLSCGKNLEIVYLKEIPEQTDLDNISHANVQVRAIRRRVDHMAQRQGVKVRFDALVSHDISKTINDISQRTNCQWLVTEWGGRPRETFTLNDKMRWLKNHLSCHLMTFRDKGVLSFKKILVIVDLNHSNELLLQISNYLSDVNNADLTLTTYIPPHSDKTTYFHCDRLLKEMSKFCSKTIETLVLSGKSDWSTFCQVSDEFDLVILESSRTVSFYQRLFGSMEDKIMEHSTCSVASIMVCHKDVVRSLPRKIMDEAQEVLFTTS